MQDLFRKYFFAIIWFTLSIVISVILDRYYQLAWAILISIGISTLLYFIYSYFFNKFKNLYEKIDQLNFKVGKILDALGGGEEFVSWSLFWSKVLQLAAKIEGSNFKPDIIVSCGRSGAVVGGMLASILGSIKIVGIDRIVVITKKPNFPEERNIEIDESLKLNFDLLNGKKILFVMSECTTGNTLCVANDYFRKISNIKLKTAVIFSKTSVICKPDFYVDYTDDKWSELPFRIEGKWKNYFPRIEKIFLQNK